MLLNANVSQMPVPMPEILAESRAKLAWKLRAVFDGKTPPREYLTPDIRFHNPGWGDDIFNRRIEILEFYLPTSHKIHMAGMEAYNFFVEATQSMSRKNNARIEAFWICGKFPETGIIEMWRIGNGKVIRQRKTWGREWGGAATSGWKMGNVGGPVQSLLIKL
jgi:hypothetical protein